ncbi:MAG TPA: HepT-like ribonuclease domain-containing protein [Roseiflexaceae bacterium]
MRGTSLANGSRPERRRQQARRHWAARLNRDSIALVRRAVGTTFGGCCGCERGAAERAEAGEGIAMRRFRPFRLFVFNKIVHDYLNMDEDVVWQVVTDDLPPLIAILETIVPLDES